MADSYWFHFVHNRLFLPPCPQSLLTVHGILSPFTHSQSCCSESSFYIVVWIIILKCRSNEFTLFLKSLKSFPWFYKNIYWDFHVWFLPDTCSFPTLLYGLARMVFLVSQYNVSLCLKFSQYFSIPIRKEISEMYSHNTQELLPAIPTNFFRLIALKPPNISQSPRHPCLAQLFMLSAHLLPLAHLVHCTEFSKSCSINIQ